jgi:hypothetical protein
MRIFLAACLLVLISCNGNQDQNAEKGKDTTAQTGYPTIADVMQQEPDITDSLLKLPFIIRSNNYIDSISNHQQGIAFLSDSTATEIVIRAGYNGEERFETYHTFIVDRKTGEIRVSDPVSGEDIPLKDYLKNPNQ